MDIEYRKLTNFQTTRFANSVRFVFINLRDDYGAVKVSMKNVIDAKEISSNADDRAKTVLRNINSWVFCLCLSGCADVYNLFGIFAPIRQTVNLLPHERYDDAMAVIAKFVKMLNCMEHRDCPPDEEEKSQCLWPRYHADVAAMEMNGEKTKINHINMGSSRQTRLQVQSADMRQGNEKKN